MKKLYLTSAILFLLTNIHFAGDRMVLIEKFTSATCPPCASQNPLMNSWLAMQDPDRVAQISYHMNWPAPGNDPFYLYNPSDNTTRRTFYGVNSIPQARMDGIYSFSSYAHATLNTYFDLRKDLLSPVTVIVTDSTYADTLLIRARIYCEVMLPNPSVTVYFAVIEKLVQFSSPPGTNGETQFHNPMRRMPVTANGETLTLLPGQTYIIERKVWKDPIWQPSQVKSLVFLQQGSEILNAASTTNNFTLIPISSYKSVQQGQPQTETYQMSIPVTSGGYNSPVTLTAQVEPAEPGITVSFPGGNVINTFPSNFNVQVSSTASVPSGAYRIIITGTNTNGKVHKTSVSYLVGKNYIIVKANRDNLKFAVNGTEYTGARIFDWNLGSSQTLSAVSPQTFGATRHVFQNWSNGGDSSHVITVGTTTNTYTVNYKTQFRLIANVTPSGIPVTVNGGNIFYDSASSVTFSPSVLQVMYNGYMYYFQRWNGNGAGSYNGTNPQPTVQLNNPISQTAVFDTIVPFGITNLNIGVPKSYALYQNYPNPFNPVTKIKFDLPRTDFTNIKIYDLLGSEIATIYEGELQAGYYEATIDASGLASGVYLYRITSGDYTSVRRMVLLK
ncbi:MAG: T9SS type A sorting domain-containing protein [Ignavibacteria bacterium]|nr:T9SS type A sorting domain-containing protein [Ignavibacteria bacterium]